MQILNLVSINGVKLRRSRFVALIGVSDPTVMAIKSGNWLLRRTTKSLLILA